MSALLTDERLIEPSRVLHTPLNVRTMLLFPTIQRSVRVWAIFEVTGGR